MLTPRQATAASMFLFSFGLVLFELALTRLFGVVLFASFAHLALALALMGISVGALLQHMFPSLVPDEGLEERLGWLSLLQAGLTVFAVLMAVLVPITEQFAEPPAHYGERSQLSWDLVDPFWFAVLMPVLAAPFCVAGLAFAGAFQRRKEDIGLLYGFDLVGGAAAAVVFVPLLYLLPGPDTVFVVGLAGCLGAAVLFGSIGRTQLVAACAVPAVVCLLGTGVAATGTEVLKVRFAAGYSEVNVTYTRWTPLTRLAVHEDERGHFMLLDNTSASEIVRSEERVERLSRELNRALVYQFMEPPGRVAILAASAGPEVAVAQHHGFTDIDAVDIAPEIGDVVAERYPDNPINPYLRPGTNRVLLDGRAAILHAPEDYDIIQMVHANLHSSAGQLANAWSPALLETREAFVTYLSRLTPDGTLSFGRGSKTWRLFQSAAHALMELGVEQPKNHILWVQGPAQLMMVKPRPWTAAERDRVLEILEDHPRSSLRFDPVKPDHGLWDKFVYRGHVLTDDRPYVETTSEAIDGLYQALQHVLTGSDEEVAPVVVLYHVLALQVLFVLAGGLLCIALPMVRREPTGLTRIHGVGAGLAYVACLGYGYLAVETVLLHELVLFVGHPTYAITVVILAMLLFSGLGSMLVQRLPIERLPRILLAVLAGVVLLALLQAFVVPSILYALFFGLPLGVRAGIVFVVLAPLGFLMGMPFPTALRILRPEAAGLVPWAWALNGWMSVVASLGTVLLSRLAGYRVAFLVAIGAYILAFALSIALPRIGADRPPQTEPG